jgi:hypothetical protein
VGVKKRLSGSSVTPSIVPASFDDETASCIAINFREMALLLHLRTAE